MSGQPLINPNDASKFRQQYLANLALEAKNNDVNLQANKIFIKTGQTPTQVTDGRTTFEKLADIENLKVSLRSQLSQIADGQNAQAIVEGLSNEELQFLAQQINQIITQIKPQYLYGVPADIFIPYLKSYMDMTNETNGVNFGLQQTSGSNVLSGITQILGSFENLPSALSALELVVKQGRGVIDSAKATLIDQHITDLTSFLPALTADFNIKIMNIDDATMKARFMSDLNDLTNQLPTQSEIFALTKQLEKQIRSRDKINANATADDLLALIDVDNSVYRGFAGVIDDVNDELARQQRVGGASSGSSAPLRLKPVTTPTKSSASNPSTPATTTLSTLSSGIQGAIGGIDATAATELRTLLQNSPDVQFPTTTLGGYSTKTRDEMIAYLEKIAAIIKASRQREGIRGKNPFTFSALGIQKGSSGATVFPVLNEVYNYLDSQLSIAGHGIGKKKTKTKTSRISGTGLNINKTKGMLQINSHVPFGRYYIDNTRLGNNIVALKRENGVNVSGMPVVRVSPELGSTLRTIVGGGQPQYHDLGKLSDDEKKYLYKITKTSKLLDRLSIPTPSKDENEKDINQFEIYKGEILNGNNSGDLVKKFKILIVKMITNDLLPKGQAKQILLDLATIGY